MPELPEVEVLVRHLEPLLKGRRIRTVEVRRAKVVLPTSPQELADALVGAAFTAVARRGKYVRFFLRQPGGAELELLGHLGMTGRMYLLPAGAALPRHTAVRLGLGDTQFVFEDTRYFGRLTLDRGPLARLGPEPLGTEFTAPGLAEALRRSRQPIKVKLLDQSVVAGVGNIYASEALFHAGISPRRSAASLRRDAVDRLWTALRQVLAEAIAWGSTVPLDWAGSGAWDGLFHYGRARGTGPTPPERLLVYDHEGQPCVRCGARIRRLLQAGRSTFFCPRCQRPGGSVPLRSARPPPTARHRPAPRGPAGCAPDR